MIFTLGSVACMGACSQAPVMRIGEQTYGNLTPDLTRKAIRTHHERVRGQQGLIDGSDRTRPDKRNDRSAHRQRRR